MCSRRTYFVEYRKHSENYWYKNQPSTHNKVNVGHTSLFHSLTCFGAAGQLVLLDSTTVINTYYQTNAELCIKWKKMTWKTFEETIGQGQNRSIRPNL